MGPPCYPGPLSAGPQACSDASAEDQFAFVGPVPRRSPCHFKEPRQSVLAETRSGAGESQPSVIGRGGPRRAPSGRHRVVLKARESSNAVKTPAEQESGKVSGATEVSWLEGGKEGEERAGGTDPAHGGSKKNNDNV